MTHAPSAPAGRLLPALLVRSAAFMLIWWAVTEGDMKGWWAGLLAVAGAVAVSLALAPPMRARLRPFAFLPFAWFFLAQSFLGGLDVARRAFDPRLPLAPGVFVHKIGPPADATPALVADVLSLLPGTVGAGLEGRRLTIHVLDSAVRLDDRLANLEAHVGALFSHSPRDGDTRADS